ncbi:Type IV leader peptidase family/Archaeal Peptidase A24 C-terminus Type II [Geoglobus ahangari]|uniref:Type IV leader peptidase family/Archaeal Peptidase A24 C-terminus Type II n=1 Tax=Geoglobus ahangari TaxID=113653 RepID=A0A0F7IGV4_9EURY|nr:A24 family peptidase C-terminal domain-containing protein [Geoglobus ahangari]AKG91905.1 Type IV leader peptidase family/Archaeal Peptidase A24 C-terminus Type II [Geoglobus ahangari]
MEGEVAVTKFLIGLLFLLWASRMDLRSRIIPNRVWKLMFLALLPFTLAELLLFPHSTLELYLALFQAVFVISLAFIFYYLGLYGGADAKALMVLALTFPFYPSFPPFPILMRGFSFAFSTLANAVIFAPLFAAYFFLTNLLREGVSEFRRSKLYFFIGRRVDASSIPPHHSLLEYVDERGGIVRLKRGVEPDSKMLERLKKAKKGGKVERVWVTPQIPFIVFMTLGYAMAFLLGDVLSYAVTLLLP